MRRSEWRIAALARLTLMRVVSTICALCGRCRAGGGPPAAGAILEGSEIVELGTGWYLRGDIGYVDYVDPAGCRFRTADRGAARRRADRQDRLARRRHRLSIHELAAGRTRRSIIGSARSSAARGPIRPMRSAMCATGRLRIRRTILFNAYADLGSWAGSRPMSAPASVSPATASPTSPAKLSCSARPSALPC